MQTLKNITELYKCGVHAWQAGQKNQIAITIITYQTSDFNWIWSNTGWTGL